MSEKPARPATSEVRPPLTVAQPPSSEVFLTKRQFAALLQVTERTIDRWLSDGELPPESKLSIGGCVRFRPVALEQWISSRQNDMAD